MPSVLSSQVLRFAASISVIVLLTPLSWALAQQNPATHLQPSQTQLNERVKELETRLNAAEQKAASAAMEKDYITRVQKEYEAYYEKAFDSQRNTVWAVGLIFTLVLAVTGRFSFSIFEKRIEAAIEITKNQLERTFKDNLAQETAALDKANQDRLASTINDVKAQMEKVIENV
jgi:hypothetical protein